ncbi:hypothetical protein [Thermococcus sp.]|uniref:hypothetical protein n=1 Tax=Thermococcus sp. TaxID=35749 RepID=UPI00262AFFAA|nr:hypothetical protein [Thermococcus sp.]
MRNLNLAGGVMGVVAGLVSAMVTLALFGIPALYLEDAGHGTLSAVIIFLGLPATVMAGFGGFVFLSGSTTGELAR